MNINLFICIMKNEINLTRKLQAIGDSLMITIPSQIVRAKGWKKGNIINCEINKEGNIVLKKGEMN